MMAPLARDAEAAQHGQSHVAQEGALSGLLASSPWATDTSATKYCVLCMGRPPWLLGVLLVRRSCRKFVRGRWVLMLQRCEAAMHPNPHTLLAAAAPTWHALRLACAGGRHAGAAALRRGLKSCQCLAAGYCIHITCLCTAVPVWFPFTQLLTALRASSYSPVLPQAICFPWGISHA